MITRLAHKLLLVVPSRSLSKIENLINILNY